ncbi:hypothetical protein Tco_0129312 [Tanacetum coccineum]
MVVTSGVDVWRGCGGEDDEGGVRGGVARGWGDDGGDVVIRMGSGGGMVGWRWCGGVMAAAVAGVWPEFGRG